MRYHTISWQQEHSIITAKQVNFAGNLISWNLRKVQIREIKLPQNCKFDIDNNGKFSIFVKSSCH